jgi:IS4 transposase
MVPGLEKESLTVYDRLYFCLSLVKAHYARGNHFLFRCRKNACKEILEFFNDPKKPKTKSFLLQGKYEVHLIRIANYETGKDDVFATSLDPAFLKARLVKKLYRLRWEVETSFLELTGITKAEQWGASFFLVDIAA